MMLFLRYDVSLEGFLSIARRYGSPRAVEAFLDRLDRNESNGEALPLNASFLHRHIGLRGGPTVLDVLRAQDLLPMGGLDREVFTRRVAEDQWVTAPVPAASDLDPSGRCRCGCGYGDEPRQEPTARPRFEVTLQRFTVEATNDRGRVVVALDLDAVDRTTAERAAVLMLPDAAAFGWVVSVRGERAGELPEANRDLSRARRAAVGADRTVLAPPAPRPSPTDEGDPR